MTQVSLIKRTQGTGEMPRYRVWHAYNAPNNMDFYAVESPEAARTLIEVLTRKDLKDRWVVDNAFGLEELEEGEYHEWYDEHGNDISENEEEG